MKLKSLLSLAIGLTGLAATAAAAPSVSGVSGTPATGQNITITGAGFGVKSPAAPYIWADFENGINPSSLGQHTNWDTIGSMTWASGEGYNGGGAAKASDGSGNWTLRADWSPGWTQDGQKTYLYKRLKTNFVVSDASQNWKIFRAWAPSGHPNIYAASNNNRLYVEYVDDAGVDSGFWGNFNANTTSWYSEEVLMKASSINQKNGSFDYRINGQSKSSGAILTRSSGASEYMTQMYAVHSVLANSSLWSPAWSSNNRVWADNVYLDYSWGHVMIGNASTLSSCTNMDIQVPSAWSDGSITVRANTPSFANGTRAYVYVWDANGNVNSTGYAITVGSGGTSPSNVAPTISAGPDQTVTLGSAITLTGTKSDDGLPNPPASVSTSWTLVSGPTGSSIASPNSLSTSVTATTAGTYVFRLTGTDGSLSASDDVTVAIQAVNQAPNANAGVDATVTLGTNVSLSGTASDDGLPSGTLTYGWSKVSGPSGSVIANASSRNTTVSFTTAGTYVFRLTANDGALSDTDDIQVTVNAPANVAPTVSAGSDVSVALGTNASLTGSASDDGLPSGTLTTAWTKVSGPTGAVISNASAKTTTVSFTTAGTYVFRITANDGSLSSSDDVQVTVNAPANAAPTASAGSDVTVTLGTNASLAGTASDDGLPSGTLTTTWSKVSGPTGATIANASALNTTVSFTAAGTYVFRLTASDGSLSVTDDLTVTVQTVAPTNAAPTVNAGSNATLTLGTNGSLNGSASDDGLPSGTLTTTWSKVSGPAGAVIANASAKNTTVSFTTAGTYVFRLTANDGALSASDDVQLTVNAPANGAPTVNAGTDATATVGQSASVAGQVSDDGLPNPPAATTVRWTSVAGPSSPTFSDSASLSTNVTFPVAGRYVLRLTANDGAASTSDDVAMTVSAPSPTNFAPTVSAGTDLVVTLPAQAALSASGSDDGLPSNTITYAWGKVSGPGTVAFGDVNAATTWASFSTSGLYVLAVTANDGQLSSTDQIQIDVRASAGTPTSPTVAGLSGRLVTGQQLQVVGSGFGVKSPAAPLLYADFENGLEPSTLGQVRNWSAVQNMEWSAEGYDGTKAAKASDGNGVWTMRIDQPSWSADSAKIYMHRRSRMNFVITDASQDWKMWRMWAANFGYPSIYAESSSGKVAVENLGTEGGFTGSFRQNSTNWSTEEILMQASSGADKKDGTLVVRYDGVEKSRGSIMTKSSTAQSAMAWNYAVHAVAANKASWAPAWNTNNRVWVDDVYVDNSWARVMVGDAATFASCRTLDIQIPTGWADGAITFVARTASFKNGDRAYLYVIDKDGNANANGFPVKINSQHFGSLVDGGSGSGQTVEESPRNVFNPARGEQASLTYALKERGSVKVLIYDRGGRRVKELVGDEVIEGSHTISWDGRNDEGSLVASGVYVAVAKGSEGTRTRQKIAVIK